MLRRRHRDDDDDRVQPEEPEMSEALFPGLTVVGRETQLEGTLESAASIRIDGQAKGKIAAEGDVILSSHSHVEADIQAQNVVMGGTLKGDVTARTKTELAQGGRVEGKIRSKVLVVNEGAVFSGQANTDLEDAPTGTFPEDGLRTAYDQATRRAADWYRSSLSEPMAEPVVQDHLDHDGVEDPDVEPMSDPDEPRPVAGGSRVYQPLN